MRAEDLVRMANQIAHFFAPYPEADAIEGVRDHIAKFWDPSMRDELIAIGAGQEHPLSSGASRGSSPAPPLDPLVLRAIVALRGTAKG